MKVMHPLDIASNLFTRYELTAEIKNYFGIQAMFALAQMAIAKQDNFMLERVKNMIHRYPDDIEHPNYNFDYYRCGGNCQAYLLLMGENDQARELIREYAEKTIAQPTDDNGIQCMRRCPEMQKVWIDIVHTTTPFMVMAGVSLQEPRYIDFGIYQIFALYDLLEDPSNHLLHQCRGFMADPNAISQDHWGRGNGWGVLGLADLLQFLPKEHPQYAEAARRFRRHMEALLPYQTSKGLWRQSIAEELAWEESSGSAMFTYGMGVGMRLGILPPELFRDPFERALRGLVTHCLGRDFSTYRCCPGCLCPGEGPEKGTVKAYITEKLPAINDGHSFGPIMLAMLEAYKNGINQLPMPE